MKFQTPELTAFIERERQESRSRMILLSPRLNELRNLPPDERARRGFHEMQTEWQHQAARAACAEALIELQWSELIDFCNLNYPDGKVPPDGQRIVIGAGGLVWHSHARTWVKPNRDGSTFPSVIECERCGGPCQFPAMSLLQ